MAVQSAGRNEQKSLPDIFRACVFAVGRTADRSFQFWLVKNLTGDFTRNNSEHTRGGKKIKIKNFNARFFNLRILGWNIPAVWTLKIIIIFINSIHNDHASFFFSRVISSFFLSTSDNLFHNIKDVLDVQK